MSIFVLIAFLAIPITYLALVCAARFSTPPNDVIFGVLATVAAIPMLGFFAFGFLASFEPVANAMMFRIVYVALFAIVTSGVVAAWWPKRKIV